MKKLIKVQAECLNGIYKTEQFDPHAEVLSFDMFHKSLKTVVDETLACEVTQEQLAKLHDEYGVKQSHLQ